MFKKQAASIVEQLTTSPIEYAEIKSYYALQIDCLRDLDVSDPIFHEVLIVLKPSRRPEGTNSEESPKQHFRETKHKSFE